MTLTELRKLKKKYAAVTKEQPEEKEARIILQLVNEEIGRQVGRTAGWRTARNFARVGKATAERSGQSERILENWNTIIEALEYRL